MLDIGQIPDREPELSVGIILPEDAYKIVEIEADFQNLKILNDGKSLEIPAHFTRLTFVVDGVKVSLKIPQSAPVIAESFQIIPKKTGKIAGKSGLRVNHVIAGRDFHWRKKIPVHLPGKIEIKVVESALVLINDLPFEIYLMCVATSEMGAACPPALIEAQTIAARSWMLANVEKKHRHLGMDVCNDDCCQRYQGTNFLTAQSIAGARNTIGKVAMFEGQICDARYSKSCGGMMESFETIWGGSRKDYLQIKPDWHTGEGAGIDLRDETNVREWLNSTPPAYCSSATVPENEIIKYLGSVDEKGRYYRWQFLYTQAEMCATLNETLALGAAKIYQIKSRRRGGSGRLQTIGIVYQDERGHEMERIVSGDVAIRAALSKEFLYSAAFVVDHEPAGAEVPRQFKLRGGGWGHGVGLCQIGALGMALCGYSTEQIIAHYYPNSQICKIY